MKITSNDLVEMRNALIGEYYEEVANARENGKPVAHITGYMPQEILYAMGIIPAYPENYAPLNTSQEDTDNFCQSMERQEYSSEVCGYAKAGLGAMFEKKGPWGSLPKPDVVISFTDMRSPRPQWLDVTSRYTNVSHFLLDVPHSNSDPQERHFRNFVKQLKEAVRFLENTLGLVFSWEKLRETVLLADQASQYYIDILEMLKISPSPLSFRELSGHIFPLCVLSGTQKAVDFYKSLRDFVADRVINDQGVVKEEKYRLAWDNTPIWHDMPVLNYLEDNHAVVVYSTYESGTWGQRLDPDYPFESMAGKYLTDSACHPIGSRIDMYRKKIKEYNLKGVIFHVNQDHGPFAAGQYDLAKQLREKDGIPSLLIEGKMAAPRKYSKSDTRRRIDEFLELLG